MNDFLSSVKAQSRILSLPCLELGLDNWLTCPHLGKMLRMENKGASAEVLFTLHARTRNMG